MASVLSIRCDRCHRVVDRDRSIVKIATGPLRNQQGADLCLGCARDLVSWLAAGNATSEAVMTPGGLAVASEGDGPDLQWPVALGASERSRPCAPVEGAGVASPRHAQTHKCRRI